MPTNKNAMLRYLFLDEMLSDRLNRYTCDDLREKCNERLEALGYPKIGGDYDPRYDSDEDLKKFRKNGNRVIQMDLQALQESPFNLEIYVENNRLYKKDGKPTYRYVDQTKTLFHKPLSEDEKNLLREVLNTLGQFSGLDNFEWLADLQEKLKLQSSFGQYASGKEYEKRTILSFSTNRYLEYLGKSSLLGWLFTAISRKSVIKVSYRKFTHSSIKVYIVYPYLLKLYNERWYLVCTPVKSVKTGKYNPELLFNLAIDRIESYEYVNNTEFVECPLNLDEWFDDVVGITRPDNKELEDIIFCVHPETEPYISTKPLHGSQARLVGDELSYYKSRLPLFNGWTFFRIHVIPDGVELIRLLRSYGDRLIVVSPAHLRDEVAEVIRRQDSLYSSIPKEIK